MILYSPVHSMLAMSMYDLFIIVSLCLNPTKQDIFADSKTSSNFDAVWHVRTFLYSSGAGEIKIYIRSRCRWEEITINSLISHMIILIASDFQWVVQIQIDTFPPLIEIGLHRLLPHCGNSWSSLWSIPPAVAAAWDGQRRQFSRS